MVGAGSEPAGSPVCLEAGTGSGFWIHCSPPAGVLCPGFLKTKSEKEPGNTFVGTGEPVQSRGNSQVGWQGCLEVGWPCVRAHDRGRKLKQISSPEESGDMVSRQTAILNGSRVAVGILAGKSWY